MSLPCSIIFLWHPRPPQKPFQIPHSPTQGIGFRDGKVLNKCLYKEALLRGQTPYLFMYHFLWKSYPFRIPGTAFAYLV